MGRIEDEVVQKRREGGGWYALVKKVVTSTFDDKYNIRKITAIPSRPGLTTSTPICQKVTGSEPKHRVQGTRCARSPAISGNFPCDVTLTFRQRVYGIMNLVGDDRTTETAELRKKGLVSPCPAEKAIQASLTLRSQVNNLYSRIRPQNIKKFREQTRRRGARHTACQISRNLCQNPSWLDPYPLSQLYINHSPIHLASVQNYKP